MMKSTEAASRLWSARHGVSITLAFALTCAVSGFSQAAPDGVSANGAVPEGSAPRVSHSSKRRAKPKAAVLVPETQPVVEAPAAPPMPNWPVNDKAERANVIWDGRDLSVTAANSALQQVLRDVSTATGVKVEGLQSSSEQRIYGSYGPASARDVLAQLLEGSGYNVLMVGDQGAGTPRMLVLSAKRSDPAASSNTRVQANGQDNQAADDDVQEAPEEPETPQAQPQPPPALRQPYGGPPQGGRTPQEMMQEMQQRQQQLQQQQQQQQTDQPPQQPGQQTAPQSQN